MVNDSARVDDELDVVLDGHRHLYRSELGPAVEAAMLLAEELRAIELPPQVAERHVAMAMDRARRASTRSRRRSLARAVATAAAAAAIVGVPASLVSGRTLPGHPLYPLKRTIEAADLAFTFDPCREAEIHMRIAETRIGELEALVQRRDNARIVGALREVKAAVDAANVAVAKAVREEGANDETMALRQRLTGVNNDMKQELKDVLEAKPTNPAAAVTASSILSTTATPPVPSTAPQTTSAPPQTTAETPPAPPPSTSPNMSPTSPGGSTAGSGAGSGAGARGGAGAGSGAGADTSGP
ncbi:MAG TPA: DUF5667 domain-containing protein [Actinomycetes bacterium]|nr:DUF5667 domain-containing protein [Actinomycetes bacterium]